MLLTQSEYKDYCNKFKYVWSYLQSTSHDEFTVQMNICEYRGYDYERMSGILSKVGFVFPDREQFNQDKLKSVAKDLGLFTQKGNFLLIDRFIFPVRDMLGNIIALIGWFPDEKKYITTPSKLFSKECLFFGMEQLSKTNIGKKYVLVEGIFDSLSVRSLGIPCIAQMGIVTSRYKQAMYSLFGSLLAIPDNDSEGRKVISEDKWRLPRNAKYLKWSGKSSSRLKDIDDLVKTYDSDDVKELLLDAWKEDSRIVNVQLG